MRRMMLWGMAAMFLLGGALGAWAQEMRFAQPNPEYGRFDRQAKGFSSSQPMGFRPAPLDLRHVRQVKLASLAARALPATYDLRTQNRLTPVRNQGAFGTCWAFAALGSMESGFMPGENEDLSEWHLAWFAFEGDSPFSKYNDGPVFNQGGNDWIAVAVLARWQGAAAEEDAPYAGATPSASVAAAKHLQQALFLGSAFDADTIKNSIMQHGGVSVSFAWSEENWNAATAAFYCPDETGANHGVMIVGWDDNFSAANFRTRPEGDGAWIIRNSWGPAWGQGGYFYLSYYDKSLGDGVVYQGEAATNYSGIYQYDPLGWITGLGYGAEEAWMANVFTATREERIEAVSFYAGAVGTSYTIAVYGDVAGMPTTGRLLHTPESGTLDAPGYRTICLQTPVVLRAGMKFSVVVKLTTPGYTYPVPVERFFLGYSDAAAAAAGESFSSGNGTDWNDLGADGRTSVCLKVFTNTTAPYEVDPTPTPTPTVTPTVVPSNAPTATPTPPVTTVPSPTSSPDDNSGGGGGGGCNAGSGYAAMLLLPLFFLRRSGR